MFKKIRAFAAALRQRRRQKWADDHAWAGAEAMDRAQENFHNRGESRAGLERRKRGSPY